MFKRGILITILFICLFFNIKYVSADSYDCAYKVSFGEKQYTFTATFNTEKKTVKFSNICWNNGVWCRGGSLSELDTLLLDSDTNLSEVKDDLLKQRDENLFSGNCDSTLLIFKYWSNGANHDYFKVLFNDTLEASAKEYMNGNFSSGSYKELTNQWSEFDDDNSTAPSKDISYSCDSYTKLFDKIDTISQEIKNCGDNCSNLYVRYEELKSKLISFCNIQFQHLDYGKSCLNACLNLKADIDKLGVENPYDYSACGFSEKLIIYIANIVKWLKYLIPIIVIVLGILDFIKAIASEKDDEMKKAQGHFVKRLIAAALIFIVPFIIEFVLDKMGFASNACGIIDL